MELRVVSLCPSLTELVFDLGAGSSLVGVTRYCIHPQPAVAGIEQVGGTKNPKVERVVALAPDLVLMNEEENRREDFERLVAAGLHCLNTFPKDAESTASMVIEIGAALEKGAAAAAIAKAIRKRARAARVQAACIVPRVRFAYLIWKSPWMSASADTYASALLTLAGGENVFAAEPVRYPEITLEALVARAPELVLLSTEPFHFDASHALLLARATGIDPARVIIADGEALAWHGSRTPAGIDHAMALLAAAMTRRGSAAP